MASTILEFGGFRESYEYRFILDATKPSEYHRSDRPADAWEDDQEFERELDLETSLGFLKFSNVSSFFLKKKLSIM